MHSLLLEPAPPLALPRAAASSWRDELPILANGDVTVRELRTSDADSLFALLTTTDVTRLISAPPTRAEDFERFIAWTRRQRAAGGSICLGIVPRGEASAVGLIQVRARDARWDVAEWGFAVGSPFWGTGLFMAAAKAALGFTFGTLGVTRLEARSAVNNGRGIGVLRKLGGVEEAVLRRSLRLRDEHVDQALLTLFSGAKARRASRECAS